jgi:hypothetical protein
MTGTDEENCMEVQHPCRTMQYAVDAAGEGEVVKVAAGVYSGVGHCELLALNSEPVANVQ